MKLLKISILLLIVALLVMQTNVLQNIFKPNTAYAVGDLVVDWGIGVGDVGAIFTVTNMAPGDSEDEDVDVTNNAATGRPVAIKGVMTSETGSLSAALDIEITDGSTTLYANTLQQFFTDSLNPDGISLLILDPSEAANLNIKVTFQDGAGNEFQNTSVVFNLIIGIGVEVPAECEQIDLAGKFPIFGTSGNDRILGTNRDDVIFAFEGNDRVFAHGGNDCIVGSEGVDELRGETGNDIIFGNEGNDLLIGAVGNDIIFGGSGADTIRGENGEDILEGEDGNDNMFGGNSDDIMHGGNGNDTMNGENGSDNVNGDTDNDTLIGGNGSDTLIGGANTDKANGMSGTDTCDAETEIGCEL